MIAVKFCSTLLLTKAIAARFCVCASVSLVFFSIWSSFRAVACASSFPDKQRHVHRPSGGIESSPFTKKFIKKNSQFCRTCFIAREMSYLLVFSTLITDSKNGLATSRRLRWFFCNPSFAWIISHLEAAF